MSQVFLTGASGYIGGQVLHDLVIADPELNIRALVRDQTKARAIAEAYPQVRIVQGSLDDDDIVSKEASDANIVLHLAATGHLRSVETIHQALQTKTSQSAHWIQISGASALAAAELADKNRIPGSPSSIVFDDLDGVTAIHDVIKKHPNRAVDNYVLAVAENSHHIHTALVIPPIIYGKGEGPVSQRSMQIPELAKATLQRRRGFQVGKGENRWSNVHIQDLGQLFVALVRAALSEKPGADIWDLNGVYLTGSGETTFSDISHRGTTFAAAQGWITNDEVDEILGAEASNLLPSAESLFGTNARGKARRAFELLGWQPRHADGIEAEIPRAFMEEAKSLGIAS